MPRKAIAQLIGKVRMSLLRQYASETWGPRHARCVLPCAVPQRQLPSALHHAAVKLSLQCYALAQVFIQKAAVNLLSTVLDTPEFLYAPVMLLPHSLPWLRKSKQPSVNKASCVKNHLVCVSPH